MTLPYYLAFLIPLGMKTNATCPPCFRLAYQKDWTALAYHEHRLAGAADIIGANTIAQQGRSLEKACEKQTLSAKAEMLPRLQTLLANLAALHHAISTYTTPR
ncbi:TPA: Hpt domain-containing protein [Enterobacter asburiae]|nr:Hpt domain-containing protein [Enterobacter asburiae]